MGVLPPRVLAEQAGQLLTVRASHYAGLAKVEVGTRQDRFGERPGEAAISAQGLVECEDDGLLLLDPLPQVASVVVEHGHVVSARLQGNDGAHDYNTAPIAHRLKLAPGRAVVFGDRQPGGVHTRPHDDALGAVRSNHPMQRRDFFRRRPALRSGQAIAPGAAAVGRSLVDDSPFTVPLRVDTKHRLAVFEETGGRVAQVLTFLPVDDHLAVLVPVEIDDRDGHAGEKSRFFPGGTCNCRREEDARENKNDGDFHKGTPSTSDNSDS